jgi:hypothetical protein
MLAMPVYKSDLKSSPKMRAFSNQQFIDSKDFTNSVYFSSSAYKRNMTGSRFHAALQAHQTYEVGMNEVRFCPFPPHGIRAIGTQNLNACTAVAVISPYGAILAPPQPYPTSDPHIGQLNVRAKMMEVINYYHQNQALFPPQSSSLVVGAIFAGEPALPDHLHMVPGILNQYGLVANLAYYHVTGGEHPTSAQGTLFTDARQGLPLVYVEDRHIPI